MKDQILEHHFQAVDSVSNEVMTHQIPLAQQEHPKIIGSIGNQTYNLCELADEYRLCKASKRKTAAAIFRYDFKPHFQTMLTAIGVGREFKGTSKVKAADKIVSYIFDNCECALLW